MNEVTKRMLSAYFGLADGLAPKMFLQGFFQSPPQNFYDSEEVSIDIQRGSEDVAIAVQNIAAGYRMNEDTIYTNKGLKAPVYKEAIALNSFDLLKRMPGQDPFQNPEFRANIVARVFNKMVTVQNKIRRAIELQASQILTTGAVTLTDSAGSTLYTLNYAPKVAHFPSAGTAWDQAGAAPLEDLRSIAEVIRGNGLLDPDQVIMGDGSFIAFMNNSDVRTHFDTRRIDQGTISPMEKRGNGGTYRGVVEVGSYRFDVWTYNGRYTHPRTGVSTPYLPNDKVIVRASSGRLDATFGSIPNIGRELGINNVVNIPELPGRFQNAGGGMDLFTNVWLTPDGEQLTAGIGARPLMIPTAIDTYGCLDTGV